MAKSKRAILNTSDTPLTKSERKLMTHLKQTGQLAQDADLSDVLRWGHSQGCKDRIQLRKLRHELMPRKVKSKAKAPSKGATKKNKQKAPRPKVEVAHGISGSSSMMAPRQEHNTGKDDTTEVSIECALLTFLQHTGRLPPDADLQSLREWGRLHGHSTPDDLRQLANTIAGGKIRSQQEAPPMPAPSDKTAPSSRKRRASIQHESQPGKKTRITGFGGVDERATTGAVAMNWANMAGDMTPADLAILTHLQLIGQLPLHANLQDLLALGRDCGFTHNALRRAGDDIRNGSPCESQEAYRERLDFLARGGFEAMRNALIKEPPGVDGQRTANIAAINLIELGEEEVIHRFWRQTSTREEDLIDYEYPSVYARSRLDAQGSGRGEPFFGPIASSGLASPANLQHRVEGLPEMDPPKATSLDGQHEPLNGSASQMVFRQDSDGKPMVPVAQETDKTYGQIAVGPKATLTEEPHAIEGRKKDNSSVNDLHDFNLMHTKRMAAVHQQDLDSSPVENIARVPTPSRDFRLATYSASRDWMEQTLHEAETRRLGAENITALDRASTTELRDMQGDIVFVQYDEELDMSARLQATNGDLLDDMDIDGV